MIRGVVTDLRATINLKLLLPKVPAIAIEFEIDTAFRGALAMPPDAVAVLGLPFVTKVRTLPASGIPFQANVHHVTIAWGDQTLMVNVLAMGLRPLIGTALLQHHDLHIEYIEGGEIRIELRS